MQRLFKKGTAAVLIAVMLTVLSGCHMTGGPSDSGKGDTSSAAGTASEAAAAAGTEQAGNEENGGGENGGQGSADDDEKPGTGIKQLDYASWIDSDVQNFVRQVDGAALEDDFHLHINRDWILNTQIPDGYSSFDPITARAMEVDAQLSDILKNPEKETQPELIHDQELIQKYYNMWLDWDSRNKLGVSPLKERLEPLMKVETLEDLTEYLKRPETAISATELLQCDTSMDWNNADYYAVYVLPVDLIFGDSMYYGMMDESDAMAEPYYDKVIRHILVELGYSDDEATSILKGCFAFEKDISEYIRGGQTEQSPHNGTARSRGR